MESLEKEYRASGFKVGPINYTLQKGESLALFGPNGAGKSTLFQMITGNLDPTCGAVHLFGEKMATERFDLKKRVGYMPQHLGLPQWVTGEEILSYGAHLYELPNEKKLVAENLSYWDIDGFKHRPIGSCSHGMQKRVSLALATIHTPELLILDEPFSGLDVFHMKALDNLLLERNKKGLTTILCTHIAPYAARLCSSAAILQKGKLEVLKDFKAADAENRVMLVESRFFPQKEDLC